MKTMERNKSPFYYLLYDGKEPVRDAQGFETGEERVKYKQAVSMKANVSAASGTAQVEQFGNLASSDKVIVTEDLTCPMDENTVLFIDKAPEYAKDGSPIYDYRVMRVATSVNSISYAGEKVSVS